MSTGAEFEAFDVIGFSKNNSERLIQQIEIIDEEMVSPKAT